MFIHFPSREKASRLGGVSHFSSSPPNNVVSSTFNKTKSRHYSNAISSISYLNIIILNWMEIISKILKQILSNLPN